MKTERIFILTSEWQDDGDQHQILLYGRSPELGPVELVFDQTQPVCFVPRSEKLPALDFPFERKPVQLESLSGLPVDGCYFRNQRELKAAADRFRATGVRQFESDVRPDDRFLMERFVLGQVEFLGEPSAKDRLTSFLNPKIKAKPFSIELTSLSFDIETGVASDQLYSIAGHYLAPGKEETRVFMLGERRQDFADYALYPTEQELFAAFLQWFREMDPDLIFGWHVVGFDLMFLERKCESWGISLDLARNGRRVLLVDKPGAGYFATISGRIVIDGPQAMRAAGFRFPNYKLETVAQEILGSGKLITPNQDKVAEIERQFREDKPALARYNLEDCVLVSKIFAEVQLVDYLIYRVKTSGVTMDALSVPTAALDRLYLPLLHRKGFVAPNPEERKADEKKEKPEYDLKYPYKPGRYDQAFLIEFIGLAPALVQTFCIDPLGRVKAEQNPLSTPSGERFSKSQHILPGILAKLLAQAQEYEVHQDNLGEKATAVLIKNLVEVLEKPTCRFFHPQIGAAIHNGIGWVLAECERFVRNLGCELILADETSMFVRPTKDRWDEKYGHELADVLTRFCAQTLRERFGLASAIGFEYRARFEKLLIPPAKSSEEGKRYLGLRLADGKKTPESQGFELTGADWTMLAKNFQAGLHECYFRDQDLIAFIEKYNEALKSGKYNLELEYQKRLKRALEDYGKNPPPHVRAARMIPNPGKQIHYLMCKRGPIPTALKPTDFDYEHYQEKQLQPIADQLLAHLGKTYKTMAEPEQLGLF